MTNRKHYPQFSPGERSRRFRELEEAMDRDDIDASIIVGQRLALGEGACRYYTNLIVVASGTNVLLFTRAGDPVLFVDKPTNGYWARRDSWIEDVRVAADLTDALASELRSRGLTEARIGINSLVSWPARLYVDLKEKCTSVRLVDFDDTLASLRGRKSAEELAFIKEATRVALLAQKTFASNLKPGISEQEALAEVERVVRSNGVEDSLWLLVTEPGQAAPWVPRDRALINAPNPVIFNAEIHRAGGYAAQVVRCYCWEEPNDELKQMFQLREEIRDMAGEGLRPGTDLQDFALGIERYGAARGFDITQFGHAVGIDMADDPFINSRSDAFRYRDWIVQSGEAFAFHPMIRPKGKSAPLVWVGDVYLVEDEETSWLSSELPGIPEMLSE